LRTPSCLRIAVTWFFTVGSTRIELAAYRLVTLAFHHGSKDIELTAREAQLRELALVHSHSGTPRF
jgi:hypothetical protein